ncbi:MAG: site-specific DNA-methyltransferase [Synergistaceae bacterium]|nr:site-specific DNA-methyltransferase [Synergistaceae bacterium]
MLKLIIAQSSLPDSLILDPFAGSGASLLCALELGRKFIGIDQSEEAVRVMRERLEGKYSFVVCE